MIATTMTRNFMVSLRICMVDRGNSNTVLLVIVSYNQPLIFRFLWCCDADWQSGLPVQVDTTSSCTCGSSAKLLANLRHHGNLVKSDGKQRNSIKQATADQFASEHVAI